MIPIGQFHPLNPLPFRHAHAEGALLPRPFPVLAAPVRVGGVQRRRLGAQPNSTNPSTNQNNRAIMPLWVVAGLPCLLAIPAQTCEH